MATVTVRPPEATDWQGAEHISQTSTGTTVRSAAGRLQLPIDLLDPARQYTLTWTLRSSYPVGPEDPTGTPYAILAGESRSLSAGRVFAWTFTPDRPMVLDLTNVSTVSYESLTLTTVVPDHTLGRPQLPHDVLALDVMAPRAGVSAFRLDSSRLNRDALTAGTPWPGTFVLNRSRLSSAMLYRSDLLEWWQPVLGQARSIATRRGSAGPVVPLAQVGTLTAEFPNHLDPRAMGLRKGAPVRLYNWRTRRYLFRGTLTRVQVVPVKPGGRLRWVTHIEAADAVADLAAITRHGAIGIEPWAARLARLMASAPTQPYRIAPDVLQPIRNPTMGNTVLTTNLAKHLDVLAASARGAWWVDAAGVVTVSPGPRGGPVVATFTDRAPRADDVAPWPYVDAVGGWDWQAVVSAVDVTNYGAAWDAEQGDWREENTELTAVNDTLTATYGPQRVAIETNLAAMGDLSELAQALVRHQSSQADVTAVRVNALATPDRASALDLFDPVATELRGERRQAVVSEIAHTITPRAWATQVQLTERTTTP